MLHTIQILLLQFIILKSNTTSIIHCKSADLAKVHRKFNSQQNGHKAQINLFAVLPCPSQHPLKYHLFYKDTDLLSIDML